MFDLEKEIENWKRKLRKSPGYEDGDIEELESHLRDRVDYLMERGKTAQAAFKEAITEIGDVDSLGDELFKAQSTRNATPYWEQSSGISALLPNYIKIAWRNLIQRKGYSIINVLGLSIGLASCLLIALYVQYEWSYDTFHDDADRSYLVLREFDIPDLQTTISTTPASLAPTAMENLASVERAVRTQMSSPVVSYGENEFIESAFLLSEEGFFDIFSFHFLEGSPQLDRPNTVLITESSRLKYFGEIDPIGQSLRVGNQELEVTGILSDPPPNSHLQFDFIGSLNNPQPNWGRNNFRTYLLLRPEHSTNIVLNGLSELIQSQTNPDGQISGNDFIPHLQPVAGIHLGQGVSVDIGSAGNIRYLYLFIALAIFILILACINFMNLATARSLERAREVGMRKTLGGNRTQIAFQFLGESVLMAIVAAFLAVLITYLTLPFLNDVAGTSISIAHFFTLENLVLLIIITLLTGLIAGGYPSFILSQFQPSHVLKGAFKPQKNSSMRKGLVIFQFTISIALLAGTAIIYKQIQFMKSTGLGFEPENVLLINRANFLGQDRTVFMNELSEISGVEYASSGFSVPGSFFINSMWQPDSPDADAHNLDYSFVNFDYVETLGLEVIAGRSFSTSFESDTFAVMLNETAAREFGWTPEEAIQHKLVRGTTEYNIVGVLKDFNYESLHSEVYPVALFGPLRTHRYIAVKVNPNANLPQIVQEVETRWKQFSSLAIDYSFLADELKAQYEAEDKLIRVFVVFAGLAIFIGCLGLFGLTAFMVAQRTKEIGIRKILGASITQVVRLISIDLLKLVSIGFLVAIPFSWFMMDQWLKDFAHKTEISWWIFPIIGLIALIIALVTVSGQAMRAAHMDPVKSLKNE